jgi:hypothetical protein
MSGDHNANQKPKSFLDENMTDKSTKLEFAPGCFDGFDGTQEELDEMLAMLKKMLEDDTLFENSTLVPDEEAEAIWEKLEIPKLRS